MSAETISRDAIAAVVPDDAPEIVTVPEAAKFFGLNQGTVFYSLRVGKLRTYSLAHDTYGTGSVKGVNLREAALIWGHRLIDAKTTDA